jgi:hypothetical protein
MAKKNKKKKVNNGSGNVSHLGQKVKDSKTSYTRCADTHKPLMLVDGLVIHGGSCSNPNVDDADVYIGFDGSMRFFGQQFPWKKGAEFEYHITDGQAPKNTESFNELVDWTIEQLRDGKKVHGGCIGGHGRTGTWLAAVVSKMGVDPDPIKYVRDKYCKSAVESEEQVTFLVKNFGCKKAEPSKPAYTHNSNWNYGYGSVAGAGQKSFSWDTGVAGAVKRVVHSVESKLSVWGD